MVTKMAEIVGLKEINCKFFTKIKAFGDQLLKTQLNTKISF